MPEILHRCVEEVVGKGHDEQSAYAICRTQLGLKDNGSEDGQDILRKSMTVALPIGDYVNGDEEGDFNAARIREIIANTRARGKQIPIYNLIGKENPDHPEDLDQWPADGWAEGLDVGPNGELVAASKIHGEAARLVYGDMVRGASIGTKIRPLDYEGKKYGEVLEHIVLTNNPYMKGLNIAARLAKGGDGLAYHFTALAKEAPVAEEKKKPEEKPPALGGGDGVNLTEKVVALEVLLVEKEGVIRDLSAANANLLDEVKAFRASPQLEMALKERDQQVRINKANKVRFMTERMARDRQIDMSVLRGWYDHDSDEVVLAGFTNSQFKGSLDLLQYHRDSVPKNPTGRGFISGVPNEDGAPGYTPEQKEQIRALGKDPELLAKTRGSKNFTEYKRRKEAAAKG
jgi:hypothetical protein